MQKKHILEQNPISIILCEGADFLGKLIKWQTHSKYTHAAICVDGFVYEAVGKGVLKSSISDFVEHYQCRKYDIYVPCVSYEDRIDDQEKADLINFLERQVGKKYDFTMLIRFLTRQQEKRESREQWFCSELVFAAYSSKIRPLLNNIEPWEASPAMISWSPRLMKINLELEG